MTSKTIVPFALLIAWASLGLAWPVGAQAPGARSLQGTLGTNATGNTRSLKESLTRRTARAATGSAAPDGASDGEVGSISGKERFLRRNRRRTAYVGRDLNEMSTFVGEFQGSTSGQVRTSVSSQRGRMRRNVNLTGQRTNQTSRGIYEAPLVIGFAVESPDLAALEFSLEGLLNASPRIHHVGPLSVTVDARTATLEGVVASDEDRQLAEAYLRFEPSLSKVENRLTIQARSGKR